MKQTLSFSLFAAKAKYLDNHSCNECHEKIYEEFQSSHHSHSYFSGELHRKIADRVSQEKYECATCHMPIADNKRNDNNVTIFRAMGEKQDSESCIKCHMPEVEGGAEKMDKRARGRHASHKFLGIHDKEMREKSVDIAINNEADKLKITLKNKMDHSLIIQTARAKYLEIKLFRDGKVIWKNFDKHPSEDAQGYFAFSFKREGKKILIPATDTEQDVMNNLGARETKILIYTVNELKMGDKV